MDQHSSKTAPVIKAAGLSKVFRDFWRRAGSARLNAVDLEIYGGEVFGNPGPKRLGQSTNLAHDARSH